MSMWKARRAMRRGLATVLTAAAVLGDGGINPSHAAARKHAALVVDANTGHVMSESAADELRHPASLTKMMTLYVVFELIEQKKLTFDTRIVFSDAATRVQPTKLGVPSGGSITVLEAAKALITKSANDASVALAEHIAGSEPRFAVMMTQTARRIGMRASTFKNAHGLPDSDQVTTARDMITLGLRLQDDFPKHYSLFSIREFAHRGETHRNHNTMLLSYEGTDGIKTGYIGSSGFNLVANVRRGDKHVIGVVFGGATAGQRNNTMKTLLNMALARASTVKTRNATPTARAKPAAPVPQPVAVARPPTPQGTAMATPRPAAAAEMTAPQPAIVAAAKATEDVPVAKVRVQPMGQRLPKPDTAVAAVVAPPLASGFAATPTPPPSSPPPGVQRLNGPPTAGSPPVAGGMHLQVGAYASKAEADRQLLQVKTQAAALLGALTSQSMEAQSNGKTIYRARFTGVDPAQAGSLCNALRRQQIDCMVTRPE